MNVTHRHVKLHNGIALFFNLMSKDCILLFTLDGYVLQSVSG